MLRLFGGRHRGTAGRRSRHELEGRLAALDRSFAVIEFAMDGTILDANGNFLACMGYEREEVVGRHHSIFVDPNDVEAPEYREFWAALRQGRFQAAEYRRLAKGGREVWIQATYSPVLDRAGRPRKVVKVATDVTAQKLQLADFQGQIAAINESQAVIHFALDGTILDANDNFLRAVGYRREEVVGRHHSMFMAPEDARSHDYASFWARLGRGEFQSGEFRRLGHGGREVWLQATYNPIVDALGRPFKVVKYATDVTAEKIGSADLAGQIQAINQSQAVIQFDMNGTILDANDNFLRTLGYQLHEIRGKHHELFVDRAYAESREYQDFWRTLRSGEFHSAIYRRLGKHGREIYIQATYNPVRDLDGRLMKVVKYATDITQNMVARTAAIQAAEGTLRNVQAVAAAAEQMSASVRDITVNMGRSKEEVDVIHGHARAADTSTAQLQQAAESMDGVVQLITKIAEQINLLALNATIEAARAGEAGKGFAVVANEVKNLANQTTTATARISQEIAAMQNVSSQVVATLAAISTAVGSVRSFVAGAAGAIEEQSVVTEEISSNMQTAARGVENITASLASWR